MSCRTDMATDAWQLCSIVSNLKTRNKPPASPANPIPTTLTLVAAILYRDMWKCMLRP